MDPLALLRDKVARLSSSRAYTGLLAAVKHLEIAGRHLRHGRDGAQAYLHTDAMLRIDRAFDGVLAELFVVICGTEPAAARNHDIAGQLVASGSLSERASGLLNEHLTSWRQLLDTDLQFAASEQDAYLAFLQAAALFGVLIDELVQLQAYQSEKEKIERLERELEHSRPEVPADRLAPSTTLVENLIQLLETFARSMPEPTNGSSPTLTEGQLQGRLRGFLETVLPASSLLIDPPLRSPSGVLRPSFIVARGDESVVLEVRRETHGQEASSRSFVTEKMMMYLLTSGVACGVIAYLPDLGSDLTRHEASFKLDGRSHAIITLEHRPAAP